MWWTERNERNAHRRLLDDSCAAVRHAGVLHCDVAALLVSPLCWDGSLRLDGLHVVRTTLHMCMRGVVRGCPALGTGTHARLEGRLGRLAPGPMWAVRCAMDCASWSGCMRPARGAIRLELGLRGAVRNGAGRQAGCRLNAKREQLNDAGARPR